jgi:DNA-binding XRE family transcriptional regulator
MPVMFKSPGGEDLVILSRKEFDALTAERDEDARDAARADHVLAQLESGDETLLTDAELGQLLAAKTPMAFWRKHRGLTQQALSKLTGVAQGFLSEIENGGKSGDVQTVARIAKALGVSIDDLVVQPKHAPRKRPPRKAGKTAGRS